MSNTIAFRKLTVEDFSDRHFPDHAGIHLWTTLVRDMNDLDTRWDTIANSAPLTDDEVDDLLTAADAYQGWFENAEASEEFPIGYDYTYANDREDMFWCVASKVLCNCRDRIKGMERWLANEA
jgi:hypothetical protein